MPNVGLQLTTPRSTVKGSTNGASQMPPPHVFVFFLISIVMSTGSRNSIPETNTTLCVNWDLNKNLKKFPKDIYFSKLVTKIG